MLCKLHTQNPYSFRTPEPAISACGGLLLSADRRPPRWQKDFNPPQDCNAARAAIAPIHRPSPKKTPNQRLCDQLNNTTGLLDLLLGITAEVTGADNDGDLGETALSENLGVAEGQEVDDGGGVGLGAAQVGVTLLGGNKGPELYQKNSLSARLSIAILSIQSIPIGFATTSHSIALFFPNRTHPALLASGFS